MRPGDLPAFQDSRRRAHRLMSDASDELRSDWRPGAMPTARQYEALRRALHAIAEAKSALDEAARP